MREDGRPRKMRPTWVLTSIAARPAPPDSPSVEEVREVRGRLLRGLCGSGFLGLGLSLLLSIGLLGLLLGLGRLLRLGLLLLLSLGLLGLLLGLGRLLRLGLLLRFSLGLRLLLRF